MRQLAFALVVFCCGWAHAQNLSIESTDLRIPPAEAIVLISKSQAIYENHEFPQCTLIGYRGSNEVKKPGFVYRLGRERKYPGIDIEI